MNIRSHRDLALEIEGKSILHLNSLGKDSAVCLEWLANFARPARIFSVYFQFLAEHPDDERYLEYQRKRYPRVTFIREPNAHDLSNISFGIYQSPIEVLTDINDWEFNDFEMTKHADELMKKLGCHYKCIGNSKYESVSRAMRFYKEGLLIKNTIFPLGLMVKADILNIIRKTGMKVHPIYKIAHSTLDNPSYYRMRAAMIASPEYKKRVLAAYPLLTLDKYRYEVLFNGL